MPPFLKASILIGAAAVLASLAHAQEGEAPAEGAPEEQTIEAPKGPTRISNPVAEFTSTSE